MLFFAFLFMASSIFVPYQNTENPILLRFNDKDLSYTKSLFKPFIILVISDYSRSYNNEAIEIMAQMSLEFGERALFGLIPESQSSQIHQDIQQISNESRVLRPPFIAYYDMGQLLYYTGFSYDEVTIANTLDFWINGPKIVSNYDELMNALGNSPISIISKKSAMAEAYNITSAALRISGPIELIQAEDTIFEIMNLTDYKFAVFVKEDMSINGFSNYDDFIKSSDAHFRILSIDDVINNAYSILENTIVAIFDTEIRSEYNNTLYELKDKYPQFSYGLANKKPLFEIYSYYTHENVTDFPNFLIFNREEKFYYPFPENLRSKQSTVHSVLNEYVKLVVDEKIPREYMSEELNETSSDKGEINNEDGIAHLVGKTFENYVNDTNKDSLIFFGIPKNWPYYYKYFKDVKENVSSIKLNLKFGYIEPTKNSSPYRFPKIYSNPHFELYLRDGSMIPMLNIVNEEGILRFLHFFLPEGNLISSSNFTQAQARTERYRIDSIYKNFYDDYMELYNAMFENKENPKRAASKTN